MGRRSWAFGTLASDAGRKAAGAAAAFVLVLAFGHNGYAQKRPGQMAIDRGVALRREHKDREALSVFREAYALEQSPRALAQVALAEAAVEEWISAEADLLRALAADDPWIQRQHAALSAAVDEVRRHLGTLVVTGATRATLYVDGAIRAELPIAPLRVLAKHLIVEIRRHDEQIAYREVDVAANGVAEVNLSMGNEPPLIDSSKPMPAVPLPAAYARAETSRSKPTAAWVAAGSAALFLGLGASLTAYSLNRANYYNGAACESTEYRTRSERCAAVADEFREGQIAEWASYGIAGVSTVVSAILFARSRDPQKNALVHCLPWGNGVRFVYYF